MSGLAILIPCALFLGLLALAAFSWALNSGQFDDIDGASQRVLLDHPGPTDTAGSTSEPVKRPAPPTPGPDTL
ncbi:cbb3-type cytochrome oxidase assembly protein CcoS [Devosia salina]|uniref:Cbb3-type cytochrome oxidase assembly protein CcoS n=1 Tax=Devosia salina TaxID=2860336 RepID=A0ABX8WI85_9HYPH|nr:cbb3-type cytochrome oxidase assembly protein CcoS [Devosia salina]QYO76010.1 cbb3-type cytochrome oxidase assembly protein CcoS [Devosia salina]